MYYANNKKGVLYMNKTTDMTIKVIDDKILVKKISQQKFGNLLLPDNGADSFLRGIVCGLGTGKKDAKGEAMPFSTKIGDEVFFPKYKGYELRIEDASYVVLPEDEIIAIVIK